MARALQRNVWADQVFDSIPTVGSEPKSGTEIAAETGLTISQVQVAVGYIRDHFPEFPLVSGPAGYVFTLDGDAVQTFRRWRARSACTSMQRSWRGVVKPYIDQLGDESQARFTTRQFERLLEDLQELTQ